MKDKELVRKRLILNFFMMVLFTACAIVLGKTIDSLSMVSIYSIACFSLCMIAISLLEFNHSYRKYRNSIDRNFAE
jgi:hypothetical protein